MLRILSLNWPILKLFPLACRYHLNIGWFQCNNCIWADLTCTLKCMLCVPSALHFETASPQKIDSSAPNCPRLLPTSLYVTFLLSCFTVNVKRGKHHIKYKLLFFKIKKQQIWHLNAAVRCTHIWFRIYN